MKAMVPLYTAWNEPGMKPAMEPVMRMRPGLRARISAASLWMR